MFKIRFNNIKNMDNKEIKYLKDENGNPIKCIIDGCNNLAIRYYTPIKPYNIDPVCEYHYNYIEDNPVYLVIMSNNVGYIKKESD